MLDLHHRYHLRWKLRLLLLCAFRVVSAIWDLLPLFLVDRVFLCSRWDVQLFFLFAEKWS